MKISFIIPTYNSSDTISKAITSIRSNIECPYEIIVIDDASTDDTVELVRFMEVDTLIVLDHNYGGPNAGRNEGLSYVTGDYFCFLDHDDEVLRSFNELIVQSSELSYGDFILDRGKKEFICSFNNGVQTVYDGDYLFKKILRRDKSDYLFPNISSMLIHEKYKHIFFETEHYMCDYDYRLRLFDSVKSAVKLNKPVIRKNSMESGLSKTELYRWKDYRFAYRTLINYRSDYPKEVKEAELKLEGTMGRYFYVKGRMRLARVFFKRSKKSWKTLLYYLTTYYGSKWVKKKFKVTG